MANEKFTKGPWVAVFPTQRVIYSDSDITSFSVMTEKTRGELIGEGAEHYNRDPSNVDNISIVSMQFIDDLRLDEFSANAHLIAAAPEMYAFINKMALALASDYPSLRDLALELLAKARGDI